MKRSRTFLPIITLPSIPIRALAAIPDSSSRTAPSASPKLMPSHDSWTLRISYLKGSWQRAILTCPPIPPSITESKHGIYLCIYLLSNNEELFATIIWWCVMRKVSEKRSYEKPMLEVCGSLVEQTLDDSTCPRRLISGVWWCQDP